MGVAIVVAAAVFFSLSTGSPAVAGESPVERARSLESDARTRLDEAIPDLAAALDDPEPVVRHAAAAALGDLGGNDVERLLVDLLDSESAEQRRLAAAALGHVAESDRALTRLRKAASDPDAMVRWAVVLSLGQLADHESEPLFQELARNDPHRGAGGQYVVREAASEVLARLPRAIRWRRDLDRALEAAVATRRPVFALFRGWDDPWSERMQRELRDPVAERGLRPWVCARLVVERSPQVADDFEIRGTPTVILFAPDGREIERWPGYRPASEVTARLVEIASGGAMSELRRSAEDAPADIEAQWKAADSYMTEGREDRAIPLLEGILAADPADRSGYGDDARFALGYCRGRIGDHRHAVAVLEDLVREYPRFERIGDAWICLGLSRLAVADVDGADIALTRAESLGDADVARRAASIRRRVRAMRSASPDDAPSADDARSTDGAPSATDGNGSARP